MMTAKEALAIHLQWDMAELKEVRYHAGRTNLPVYSIGNLYMCVTRLNQKPATHRDINFEWVEKKDEFTNNLGYKIWEAK